MAAAEMKLFSFCTLLSLLLASSAADEREPALNFNLAAPEPGNVLPSTKICGRKVRSRHLTDVQDTYLDEFPWLVALLYSENNDIWHKCSGVLINSRYVLTAAHCIGEAGKTWQLQSARLGEWDKSTDTDCFSYRTQKMCAPPHIDVPIEEKIVHENYTASRALNDIALLRLKHAVNYTDYVMPICLPEASDFHTKNFTNIDMHVAGWDTSSSAAAHPLKVKASVNVWDSNKCRESDFKYIQMNFNERQLCARGDLSNGACKGVQSGPLMFLSETDDAENYFLIGIASYGMVTCGVRKTPDVYTRVDAYAEWIKQKLMP